MFTLKFYRHDEGVVFHQASVIRYIPYESQTKCGSPVNVVEFEDPISNSIVQKNLSPAEDDYASVIVENMNGQTTQILTADKRVD